MNDRFRYLRDKNNALNSVHKPEFYRLKNETDKKRFNTLISSSEVFLFDELYGQLKELIKSRNPTIKIKQEDYPKLIEQHLDGCPLDEYGVWVYYPWSARLVHILDEQEYIDLRTSANRNKITYAERDVLATKKVGVIGLSVGQSVSVTLALERGCGELRLADFDTLELNNLNRIRTGVHNLGLYKAYSVAREIAEIDPFLKVVCFTEGITNENIHDFFTKGGKLSAVIDECDGLDVKILCRVKAKEYNVPLLMETSDKGTLDVERYDLEPNRPIMHGWLDHLALDLKFLKALKTSEEKIPYILPMLGVDTISTRLKASMVEVENTITTWPQLASAVTLGGAIATDTCRRIFLDQFTESGRYFVDFEGLIPDKRPKKTFVPPTAPPPLTDGDMKEMAKRFFTLSAPAEITVKKEDINTLVDAAILAPTAGNNQPWKWLYESGYLFLFHDKNRSFSFGDFEDIASFAGLGGALENLELQAYEKNIGLTLHTFPLPDTKRMVAAIQFTGNPVSNGLYRPKMLVKHINDRCTNRNIGPRVPIDAHVYDELTKAVRSVPGAELIIKNSDSDLAELSDIMGAADRLRLLHSEGHYEFYNKELRWDAEQSRKTADGIDIAAIDITPLEKVGIKMVSDPAVAQLLVDWNAGATLTKLTNKSIDAASAVGLITMPEFTSLDYLMGGRAMERLWLTATDLGISTQPMVSTILYFACLNQGKGAGMPDFLIKDFTGLYTRFEKLFPGTVGKGQICLFRLFVADPPEIKSFRKPAGQVLTFA